MKQNHQSQNETTNTPTKTGERADIERLRKQAEGLPAWMAVRDEQSLELLSRAGAGGSY